MDKSSFEIIKTGVCAYFLILYSCMQILEKVWYSTANADMAEYLIRYIPFVLMLLGGLYLVKRNKIKAAVISDDERPFLSAAVKFIGGWVIMVLVLKYLVTFILFSMISILSGQIDLRVYLFPLLCYVAFLIAAAVTLKKGLMIKERPEFLDGIAFLCMRTILIFICVLSVRQILLWVEPLIFFTSQEHNPILMKWFAMEAVFIAAALILYFAPLRIKMNLKTTDSEGYIKLSRQSFTSAGFIILITGIPYICNAVIRKYDSFDFFFFDIKEFILQLLPTLFLVLAGLFFLYSGKDKEHMKS